MKKTLALLLAVFLLCGCTSKENTPQNILAPTETTKETVSGQTDFSDLFSDRDYRTEYEADGVITLESNNAKVSGKGVTAAGSVITISQKGTYVVRGNLENGQIIVDTDKESKVQLVLENASIHSESSAAIYVRQADISSGCQLAAMPERMAAAR